MQNNHLNYIKVKSSDIDLSLLKPVLGDDLDETLKNGGEIYIVKDYGYIVSKIIERNGIKIFSLLGGSGKKGSIKNVIPDLLKICKQNGIKKFWVQSQYEGVVKEFLKLNFNQKKLPNVTLLYKDI